MKNKNEYNVNNFKKTSLFVLFATSYMPLFVLIVLKQVSENISFLSWGGLSIDAIVLCIQKFGLSIFVCLISILGLLGYILTFKKLKKDSVNGDNVTVLNVNNKNSETAGYLATYIIPFLFQGINDWYELFAFVFLMTIIYRIYVNSNMILINPVLNFKYSIFEIEYRQQNGKTKNALVISKGKYLMENSIIKIYEVGFKLFYVNSK